MIDALPLLLGPEGYQISRSVRLRSSASAYFNRTNTASNRTTWVWSAWVKRGSIGSGLQELFSTYYQTGTPTFGFELRFDAADTITINNQNSSSGLNSVLTTTQVFRDPSAWYHIVLTMDTTNITTSSRIRLYVNGVQVTSFSSATYPSQNDATGMVNSTTVSPLYIGATSISGTLQRYFDGYLTEINFIDGQALTPASFGETNLVTGVWQPKKYAGTYGTNGFFLNFSDNSAATAAAIGKDYSGNGNNWTPTNISVTAGVTYDSMLDVPTQWADGGNGRGNYCTFNPLSKTAGTLVLSAANLKLADGLAVSRCNSTMQVSSGKWYFEVLLTAAGTNTTVGIGQGNITDQYPGNDALSYAQTLEAATKINSNTQPAYGVALTTGDIFQVAFDLDNNKLFFGKNGTWMGSSDPVAGTNPVYTLTAGTYGPIARPYTTGAVIDANFGQRPFAYTPPTGFKALNTLNLPTPTILKGNQYFDATTYTGTGASLAVTNSGGFQPDFVWIKNRSTTNWHQLYDSVRGVQKALYSNATDAEATETQGLLSFNTNGMTVGTNAGINGSGNSIVGWQWKEGPTQGFDIVTYTGTGANRTVAHSLGVAPSMMIIKSRSASGTSWNVYHASTGNTGAMFLEATNAFAADSTRFNNTSPTSTDFTVGTGAGVNGSGSTFVSYLFSEVAGFSKFGSYTGNGSADGTFVYLGFRPRYVLIKGSSFASNWFVIDTSRSSHNVSLDALRPNLDGAEVNSPTTTYSIDILSNGFKLRTSAADSNTNGATFIFAAFAETPFRNSLAR